MSYTIAYVMSLPHSGSTLCGSLLGAHPRSFCLGEPWKMRSYARLERVTTHKTALGNSCTCGAPDIWQCSFWPKVDATIQRVSGMGLRDLDTRSDDPKIFKRDNKLMFDSVAEVTGASLLVDSSKRIGQLKKLIAADFAPIKVMHLVRDPYGQVLSNMKRTGRGPYRHAVRNAIDTLKMTRLASKCHTIPTSYEHLAKDPSGWLKEVMPEFGLEYHPQQLEWAQSERHNISGNKSRATSDNTIKVDKSWETGLTNLHKTYIDIVARPTTRLSGVRRVAE